MAGRRCWNKARIDLPKHPDPQQPFTSRVAGGGWRVAGGGLLLPGGGSAQVCSVPHSTAALWSHVRWSCAVCGAEGGRAGTAGPLTGRAGRPPRHIPLLLCSVAVAAQSVQISLLNMGKVREDHGSAEERKYYHLVYLLIQ